MALDNTITGLHHITVIAGDAQENLDFYAGVLGMRLVKKTVNQDVPGTYHLFYADGAAHAGTDLTFFPWPDMAPGRAGVGLTVEVALAVPAGSLTILGRAAGSARRRAGTGYRPASASGCSALVDPHGLRLALVETADARDFTPWDRSPVPVAHQIRGLHGVRLLERSAAPTADFLTDGTGLRGDRRGGWLAPVRPPGLAARGGCSTSRRLPAERPGTWGTGSVHHVAWRVPDDATELAVQRRLYQSAADIPLQVIDRFWFKSVYFKEPGGALFEVATDGPGFGVDEPLDELGTRLVLPPWLEPNRAAIESGLPPLRDPEPATQASEASRQ